MTDEYAIVAFERAFGSRAGGLEIRPETPADIIFLRDLFMRCSPLAPLLPPLMLTHQANIQQTAHQTQFPRAMRRIVLADGQPIARIILDWGDLKHGHCVDIAVAPEHQGGGIGSALLRAWLDVADDLGMPTGLTVLRDNPAARLYRALGFRPDDDDTPDMPHMALRRVPATPPPINAPQRAQPG